eukprot:scaffold300630_cov33-Tisochrysis_lutea.AAC.1
MEGPKRREAEVDSASSVVPPDKFGTVEPQVAGNAHALSLLRTTSTQEHASPNASRRSTARPSRRRSPLSTSSASGCELRSTSRRCARATHRDHVATDSSNPPRLAPLAQYDFAPTTHHRNYPCRLCCLASPRPAYS